jgi:hypothetical protein
VKGLQQNLKGLKTDSQMQVLLDQTVEFSAFYESLTINGIQIKRPY